MGLARTSRYLLLRLIADSYVMLIRNIPPVVFVFVFVFFIASQIMPALGIGDGCALPLPPAMVDLDPVRPAEADRQLFLGLICLSVFSGAYVTEIVRAGIESVTRRRSRPATASACPEPTCFALSCCPRRCAPFCRRSRASSFS
jgi:polar amino acid transport system permease protein